MSVTESPHVDRREEILAAALVLFNEQSFAATRVPEIAKRAGVASGTLYTYWKSKDALVNDLYRVCLRHLEQRITIPDCGNPKQEFMQFCDNIIDSMQHNADEFGFLEAHCHGRYLDEESTEAGRTFDEKLVGLFERWKAAGALAMNNPELAASLVFGGLLGLYKATLHGYNVLAPDSIEDARKRLWCMISTACEC